MSEEELDDLSMPEEIGETDSQDEMYEHFSVTVDKGQGMLRIDKFLTNRMEGVSRNRIQAAADAGNILVGGTPVKSSYKVKPLDRISIVMPYPLRELEIVPENIPLDIRYEDDDLIIVNKPAGMVVHPGHGNYTGTLVNALTYHLKDLPLFQSGDMRAGLVHRIDKNTSGILVIAKNERAHARLAKQFFDHSIDRVYHALVWGNMESDEGTVTGNIGRSLRDRMKMAVFPDGISSQLLDPLAREPIWQHFANFGHGTGHGVGFFLNVHEGPQRISYPRISPRSDAFISKETAMSEGMVTSDEPGIYRPGRWGIRIENLVATEFAEENEFGRFLKFKTLTLCPIDLSAVIPERLQPDEKKWLNEYHTLVRQKVLPHIHDERTIVWLVWNTREI